MAKDETVPPPSSPPQSEGAEVQVRLTRRPPWQPSPRLPDYLLEDELNKLMDPREWKVYRALWRHSIGLRHTPLITAGYAEINEMTGLSRASIIRALKGLMKKRYVVRIISLAALSHSAGYRLQAGRADRMGMVASPSGRSGPESQSLHTQPASVPQNAQPQQSTRSVAGPQDLYPP